MFLIAYVGTALIITGVVMGISAYLAKRQGKNPYKWAGLSFFGLFVLVFWDYYPTKWAHQYYCEKEAGFWIYKTLEQWKAENPGEIERLHQKLQPSQKTEFGDIHVMDERFVIKTYRSNPIPLITTSITERRLVDKKTEEILVKSIEVGSGIGNMATSGGVKFWLNQPPCLQRDFWEIIDQLEQMRGGK